MTERDSDWLWNPEPGSRCTMTVESTETPHPLGFIITKEQTAMAQQRKKLPEKKPMKYPGKGGKKC